jgi:hypothetical protein
VLKASLTQALLAVPEAVIFIKTVNTIYLLYTSFTSMWWLRLCMYARSGPSNTELIVNDVLKWFWAGQ